MALREPTVSDPGFLSDLGAALRVWLAHPMLPALSLLLWVGPAIPSSDSPWTVALLPLILFWVGWPGTERVWYLRAFRGLGIWPIEVFSFTFRFFSRFLALGLILMVILFAIYFPLYEVTKNSAFSGALASVVLTPIDFALTFVTTALAYSTRRISVAWTIGWETLTETWPSCAPYVLIPPLAGLAAARLVPNSDLTRVGATFGSTLIYLAFTGATARFYLRRHEVGDHGAAVFSSEPNSGRLEKSDDRPESA